MYVYVCRLAVVLGQRLLLVVVATFEVGVVVGTVAVDWHLVVKHSEARDFV